MSKYVLQKNGVAVIWALNPPVNALSQAVRNGILSGVTQAKQGGAKAVVVVGDGATFPAGADIAEFASGKFHDEPDLNTVIKDIDDCEIPIIAAIHGTALGGGLETALACHYRVALPSAKVGLPEVLLGILPGAGGTQRLPRVVGAETAIDMITSGKPINASKAKDLGIIDSIVEGKTADELLAGAITFAESVIGKPVPRISEGSVPPTKDEIYVEAKKMLSKKARNLMAPQYIVDAVEAASRSSSFEDGMKEEERLFEELMKSDQAKGMQHMFFSERKCQKVPGIDAKAAADIKSVGVIGAGTMGRGIAMCFINKGIPVTLCETNQEALDAGVNAISDLYKRSSAFRSGRMSEGDVEQRVGLISKSVDSDFGSLAGCDAVIEAVFENMELKKDIFSKLGKVCKSDAMLCTNTSYLDVDEIAEASGRPESLIGTHFFSPANVMPLLENVRGKATSDKTIATAMKMGKTIGKTTVLAGNCFGFIGNRMFEPYTQQATCLIEEGATPAQVDAVLGPSGHGFAMGPISVLDLAGCDIGYRIRRESYYPYKPENVQGSRGGTWMQLADQLVDMERLGQKTKAGWYDYEGRKASESALVAQVCDEHRSKFGIAKRDIITEQEILERCMYPMINEGFRILEEGIASRSSDIDVVWNAGYGYPRYRGGPMLYAEMVGLPKVLDSLKKYQDTMPDLPSWHFEPSILLQEMVQSGKSLSSYKPKF